MLWRVPRPKGLDQEWRCYIGSILWLGGYVLRCWIYAWLLSDLERELYSNMERDRSAERFLHMSRIRISLQKLSRSLSTEMSFGLRLRFYAIPHSLLPPNCSSHLCQPGRTILHKHEHVVLVAWHWFRTRFRNQAQLCQRCRYTTKDERKSIYGGRLWRTRHPVRSALFKPQTDCVVVTKRD